MWQSGDQIRGQLRAGHAGGVILHDWDGPATGVDTSVAGELTLTIGYETSQLWTARRAVCDIEITRAGVRARLIGFVLLVDPDITI